MGTKCINLPQAHEIIKLVRLLTDSLEENIILVTETNVPSQENLEYFEMEMKPTSFIISLYRH